MRRLGRSSDSDRTIGDLEAVRGIESAPACAGQIDFAPCMEESLVMVGVVLVIPANEPGREANRAADIDPEHGQIAASALALLNRDGRCPRRTLLAVHH